SGCRSRAIYLDDVAAPEVVKPVFGDDLVVRVNVDQAHAAIGELGQQADMARVAVETHERDITGLHPGLRQRAAKVADQALAQPVFVRLAAVCAQVLDRAADLAQRPHEHPGAVQPDLRVSALVPEAHMPHERPAGSNKRGRFLGRQGRTDDAAHSPPAAPGAEFVTESATGRKGSPRSLGRLPYVAQELCPDHCRVPARRIAPASVPGIGSSVGIASVTCPAGVYASIS